MKTRILCLSLTISLFGFRLFAQNSIVDVNKPTGALGVSIPLYTVKSGNVALPVTLNYGTSGIKSTDIEGTAGIGWNVSAGGAITRDVRGVPDDVIGDNAATAKTGWITSSNGNTINSMTIANTTPNYTNVNTDNQFILSHFNDLSDTEPDMFNVNAPGLSFSFVFDKDHNIRTIPYQDVKVSYTGNMTGGGNNITSFTVKNDRGVTYVFSPTDTTTRKTIGTGSPSWFNTAYRQYANGITYISRWQLTKMYDLYNNEINLVYGAHDQYVNTSPVNVYLNPVDVYIGATHVPTQLYSQSFTTKRSYLTAITYKDGNSTGTASTAFTLSYQGNSSTHTSFVSAITGFGHSFALNYNVIATSTTGGRSYSRYFLNNIVDDDCNTPVNYSFDYSNLSLMPDTTSNNLDYWGYTNGEIYNQVDDNPSVVINPSNTALDRYLIGTARLTSYPYGIWNSSTYRGAGSYAFIGALNKITYPTGGYSTITYGVNNFYNTVSAANVSGGGIRVMQISNYDNVNASPSTVSYDYNDPSTEGDDGPVPLQSSGRPVSLPQFAFTQPYTSAEADSTRWKKSTVMSYNDLSDDDHTIIYKYVRETRSGGGSTLYQFSVPATQFDSSTPSGAPTWVPTMVYAGSPTTNSIGFLGNWIRGYPFPPSTNYDFERGLPLSVINYDSNGNEVSETAYTYNTPQTPIAVTGFKYDSNTSGAISYAKYNLYTTAGPLVTQVVSKVFSRTAPTAYQQTTVSYAYNGASHKQPTQTTTTNSDGSVYNSYVKYVKDYTITSSADNMTQALLNLQAANVNAAVESYSQVTPVGSGTPVTVAASLTKYAVFTPSGYSLTLPSAGLGISNPNGTAFTPSSIVGGNTFQADAGYIVRENDNVYDYSGYLVSSDNGFKKIATVLTDHKSQQPAAVIGNANYNEIAFNDFDSSSPYGLLSGTTTAATPGRSGQYAATIASGVALSKTITRNTLAGSYVFSAWVKTTATGTITINITGGGVTQTGYFGYANTAANPTVYPTGWQYCEVKVPLTGITSSTIAVSASWGTSAIIDDVWFYPDVASLATFGYDPIAFFKTSTTNTNGIAAYSGYDKFGRLLYTYDQDKNITSRKIYASQVNETNFVCPAISGPSAAYKNVETAWSFAAQPVYNSCVYSSGVTFTWDFGDGTTPVTTASYYAMGHQYASNGTYTIVLTASSPVYGSKSSSMTVTVTNLPQVTLHYANTTTSAIGTVYFKQNGTTIYTIAGTSLDGATIAPGVYSIVIHPTGTTYNSVAFNASDNFYQCFSRTGSDFTITSVDLSAEPNANFNMSTSACGGGAP
jgi:hypothetical protein